MNWLLTLSAPKSLECRCLILQNSSLGEPEAGGHLKKFNTTKTMLLYENVTLIKMFSFAFGYLLRSSYQHPKVPFIFG